MQQSFYQFHNEKIWADTSLTTQNQNKETLL